MWLPNFLASLWPFSIGTVEGRSAELWLGSAGVVDSGIITRSGSVRFARARAIVSARGGRSPDKTGNSQSDDQFDNPSTVSG